MRVFWILFGGAVGALVFGLFFHEATTPKNQMLVIKPPAHEHAKQDFNPVMAQIGTMRRVFEQRYNAHEEARQLAEADRAAIKNKNAEIQKRIAALEAENKKLKQGKRLTRKRKKVRTSNVNRRRNRRRNRTN